MSRDPYRPPPSATEVHADLERLAAEGRQRIQEAKSGHVVAQPPPAGDYGDYALVAIGAHRRPPLAIALFLVVLPCAAVAPVAILMGVQEPLGGLIFIGGESLAAAALVAGLFLVSTPPAWAMRSALAAERAWLASLPFALRGYFETLSAEPRRQMHLSVGIAWADQARTPTQETLSAVLGVHDTEGRVGKPDPPSVFDDIETRPDVVIRTGMVPGTRSKTDAYSDRRAAFELVSTSNAKVWSYVHDLVDKVLLPVHRDYAIRWVTITRVKTGVP